MSNISLLPNPSSQAVGIPSTGGSKTPSSGPMTDNSPTQSQQTVIHNEDGVSLPNAVSVVELNDRTGDFTKNEIKSTQNDSNHDNEIQPIFMENIGPKKIRVMALAGYEYRARDQRQKTRNQQRWVCRKANCKGRADILVDHPNEIYQGVTVMLTTGHNHLPVEETKIKEEPYYESTDSVLHDPEISKDFRNHQNIVSSSPRTGRRSTSNTQSEESTQMFSTGRVDVRGFPIRAYCKPSK